MSFTDRTEILIGRAGLEKLAASTVCIFGLGGVGAAAAMDAVRSGCGSVVVVDFDAVEESNLNRLYFGYAPELGRRKVDVFTDYARQVNPRVTITRIDGLLRGAAASIPEGCDFYIDCIDTLSSKAALMAALAERRAAFVSVLGTAGRIAPEMLRVDTLWNVTGCPLARAVKNRLRRLGFGEDSAFTSVWSCEPALKPVPPPDGSVPGSLRDGIRVRALQGSAPFVPQAAGHIAASLAVRHIIR